MSPFLFKTNEAVNKGDLDHYHCRLKVVQTYQFYASVQKLKKKWKGLYQMYLIMVIKCLTISKQTIWVDVDRFSASQPIYWREILGSNAQEIQKPRNMKENMLFWLQLPISHCVPLNPGAQLHLNPFTRSMQVPLFLQGWLAHSSISVLRGYIHTYIHTYIYFLLRQVGLRQPKGWWRPARNLIKKNYL